MISNLEKYKKDVQQLIGQGEVLCLSLHYQRSPDKLREQLQKKLKDGTEVSAVVNGLPSFRDDYQAWYSEALILLRQLLPDRVADFTRLYEKPKQRRKEITYENYVIEDALQGLRITRAGGTIKIVDPDDVIELFSQQLNIVKSVVKRFESTLFDIRQLVQADLFDSELEVAKELNKKGFFRASGAVAGVVLEGHLQQVCDNHKVKVKKKNPGINDLALLLKDAGVLDTAEWRNIQFLADLRNRCNHKKETEPIKDDIEQLIGGVSKTVKTLF